MKFIHPHLTHAPGQSKVLWLLIAFVLAHITWPVPTALASQPDINDYPGTYAISLMSSVKPVNIENMPESEIFSKYIVYTTTFRNKGVVWHRLRLGFFPSAKAAAEVMAEVRTMYRDPWITTVSGDEKLRAFEITVSKRAPATSASLSASHPLSTDLTRKPGAMQDVADMTTAGGAPKAPAPARQRTITSREVDLSGSYSINLISSIKPIEPAQIPKLPALKHYLLYTTTETEKGLLWYRLRLGFFQTQSEANSVMNMLRSTFRDPWVTTVTLEERAQSARHAVFKPAPRHISTYTPPEPEKTAADSSANSSNSGDKAVMTGPSYHYVINLLSSLKPVEVTDIPMDETFEKYRLYTTRHDEDGRVWYRLRLGFFQDRKAAQGVLDKLGRHKAFSDAWITRISEIERVRSADLAVHPEEVSPPLPKSVKAEEPAMDTPEKYTAGSETVDEAEINRMMDSAQRAMTRGDYNLAASFYIRVLRFQNHKYRQDAHELLGLARERMGDTDNAVSEYKAYLILYPKGEASDRVRQRLAALLTAREAPKKKLRKVKQEKITTEVYGSFSQFYNRDENHTELSGTVVTRSSLSSDLDLNIRRRGPEYDMRAVITGGYDYDFLDDTGNETRLSQLYLDVFDRRNHVSGRLGRQSRSSGGVLGRFDGGLITYQALKRVKVNAVAGYPVETSVIRRIDRDRYLYGLSVDLGTFAEHWDFNTFYIKQMSDGLTDRRAVGGEVRYFDPNRSFFSLVDYDVEYDEFNTVLMVGNWIFPDRSTINLVIDFRNNPILTTTNALQGFNYDSLEDLQTVFKHDAIEYLAKSRTADSWSVTLGGTRPINTKFQVSADITLSEISGTAISPGTGVEYFLSSQLIGSSLIKDGDVAIMGLRYANSSTSNTVTLNMNSRYPVNRDWRINPRLNLSYSASKLDRGDQFRISPTLRTDYYWKRFLSLEFEGGAEWTYEWIAGQTDNSIDYFLSMGYRVDF